MDANANSVSASIVHGEEPRGLRHLKQLGDLSPNEQAVYLQLRASEGPVKAYALLESLQSIGFKAPTTIYRALESLIQRGLVKKVASLGAYTALAMAPSNHLTAFVTCTICGKTQQVFMDPTVLDSTMADLDMQVVDVSIEASGRCSLHDKADGVTNSNPHSPDVAVERKSQ